MSSQPRGDSDAALLGEGSPQSGGGKDIEAADMEDFMNDILSPENASSSSSPRTTPLPSNEGVGDDTRRPSSRDREEQRSSVLSRKRGSVDKDGSNRTTEEATEEAITGTVVGKARRKRSSGGLIDRCGAGEARWATDVGRRSEGL